MALYISENSRRNGVPQLGDFDWGGLISSGLDIVKGVVSREVTPRLPQVTLPSYSRPITPGPAPAPAPAPGIFGTGLAVGLPLLAVGGLVLFLLMRRKGR